MKLKLKIWRQNRGQKGKFETYEVVANEHMSFLEMLDVLNEQLLSQKKNPVAFEHDCREGICGTCGMVINGRPHGLLRGTTTCQLHMRFFKDGDTIVIEPFRSKAFKIVKDLAVDRAPYDRIIQAGGFVSVNTGQPQDANALPVDKDTASKAFDAAACIGCGSCVAACPNGAAMLFTSAKISHLGLLPQGAVETDRRTSRMLAQYDKEGFGSCSNIAACEYECPKSIKLSNIARMNRYFYKASFASDY